MFWMPLARRMLRATERMRAITPGLVRMRLASSPERHVADVMGPVVSRPEGFHLRPLVRTVRETLASHSSHQANPPTVPFCQCAKRRGFFCEMVSRKRLARVR